MEKLEQPPSDPWVDALPLGFGAESVRQFIHIVERSKILLQFVKVRPKTARIVGVIDANQPELGLQPFLPSLPRVKILWNQFLDRPFAPLQRLAVGTPDGLADAVRIDPGGQQSLQRVRFAREASDVGVWTPPDCRGATGRSGSVWVGAFPGSAPDNLQVRGRS